MFMKSQPGIFPLLVAVVHAFLIAPSHCAPKLAANITDRLALLSFKLQISEDPFGYLSSWNNSVDHCEWFGVTCNEPQYPNRVTKLALSSLSLTGTISPNLANLTFLNTLNLSNNSFWGSIPSNLGQLHLLRYLNLSNNFFKGKIPSSLTEYCSNLHILLLQANNLDGPILSNISQCVNLNIIDLSENQLSGSIPDSLGYLPKLASLKLYLNQLTSGIPSSIGNLSSLVHLSVSDNFLQGAIPDALGKLTNLEFLNFANNSLSGKIPLAIFNISSISILYLGDNNFSGSLPHNIGNTLPNLQRMSMFYNQIGGLLPISLSNASRLNWISLHGNRFFGPMPPNLGSLHDLIAFDVGLNQLEATNARDWEFLTSLTNCSKLKILHLSINNFQGTLPHSVANLSTQITWLAMAGNQISGNIPFEIEKFTQLTVFNFASNLLTGVIPPTLSKLVNLIELDLSQNMFTGELPSSLGNLTRLSELLLGDNRLVGSIPETIGNLQQLSTLNLSHNKLRSSITVQVLKLSSLSQYLDLSHNLFTGPLPPEIGSLKNLNLLDVSENRLSGQIPASISSCLLIGSLYMQGNNFQGVIPSTMANLRGIEELDLSQNNLSGPIPQFFENFQLLQHLNLSFNNFEGQVPEGGIFRNGSAISILGNSKLCGGLPELHLQSCDHVNGMQSRALDKIIISIVAISSPLVFLVLCTISFYTCSRKRVVSPQEASLNEPFVYISYDEIHKATRGFSSINLIGKGSFGLVYKGVMDFDPSKSLAIKVINLDQEGGRKSFIAECDALRIIRHRNIINIITVCSSVDRRGNDFKAIVFEHMPNGSLDKWLYPSEDHGPRYLSMAQRWSIAMDVARALDYLHHQCHTPIVHCDLKPSNILLDNTKGARISDFGLAMAIHNSISNSSQESSCSIGLRGSIGYIAPEYGIRGTPTTQGDVYSYGVILLEMFTGKRPTDEVFQQDVNLHKYVEASYLDRVIDIIDPCILLQEGNSIHNIRNSPMPRGKMLEGMVSLFKIGLLCSQESPYDRIDTRDVIHELLVVKNLMEW